MRKQREARCARAQLVEQELGAQHPATGREYVHLARYCVLLGDTEEAERLLVQAQHICRLWQGYFRRDQTASDRSFESILDDVDARALAVLKQCTGG